MSKYDPPQCQTCADYWIKEGRPLGNFLIISRGGHIPGVHDDQTSFGGRVGGESRSQPGRPAEEKTEYYELMVEIKQLSAKLDNANKEINYIKAQLKRRSSGKGLGEAGGVKSGGADQSFS